MANKCRHEIIRRIFVSGKGVIHECIDCRKQFDLGESEE